MALGQAPFDALLTLAQPVHGGVQVVLVDRAQVQGLGQRIARGGLGEASGGGELGAGVEHAGDDQGHDAVAFGGALGGDEPLEGERSQRAEHGGDMAVGAGTHDVEGVVACDERFVLEQPAQHFDFLPRPLGEVVEGAFFDFPALAPAFAQEDGGRGVTVGDGFDEHGNYSRPYSAWNR